MPARTTTTRERLARAHAARGLIWSRAAERTVEHEFGRAVATPSLPLVRDLNGVWFEHEVPPAPVVAGLLDRLQRGERYAELWPEADGTVAALEAEGWEITRILLMDHHGEPPRTGGDGSVAEQVHPDLTRRLRREWLAAEWPFRERPELLEQTLTADRRIESAVPTTAWAAFHRDRVAAQCLLLLPGEGVAMVEDVYTTPEARGLGLASAVIGAALRAAHAEGADLVFLPTDAGGRAVRLYERLGFRPLGVVTRVAQAIRRRPPA